MTFRMSYISDLKNHKSGKISLSDKRIAKLFAAIKLDMILREDLHHDDPISMSTFDRKKVAYVKYIDKISWDDVELFDEYCVNSPIVNKCILVCKPNTIIDKEIEDRYKILRIDINVELESNFYGKYFVVKTQNVNDLKLYKSTQVNYCPETKIFVEYDGILDYDENIKIGYHNIVTIRHYESTELLFQMKYYAKIMKAVLRVVNKFKVSVKKHHVKIIFSDIVGVEWGNLLEEIQLLTNV